tara:strand:+ start:5015 stop:5548 length:534 start_codon:yes stop_codon:yes gene_type:complete
MANQRLTDKSALTNHTGTGDLYMIVDVSDTTGSSAGTSKKLDSKFVIQTDKISVSNAELRSLSSAAKTIVSAPGSGYMILPLSVQLHCDYGSDTESGNVTCLVGFALDVNYYWKQKQRVMRSITSDFVYMVDYTATTNPTAGAAPDDLPLLLFSDANFSSTDLTMNVYVTYQIVKLS